MRKQRRKVRSQNNSFENHEEQCVNQGYGNIAGIDEAGRGPLAGPVVASCVILPREFSVDGIRDSKKLTPKKREYLYEEIKSYAIDWAVGIVDSKTIDRINIRNASFEAMKIALYGMKVKPDFLLVDGFRIPGIDTAQKGIVHGDATVLSIASASIIAKVTRDRIMLEYDNVHPEYGFAKHKGYGTQLHLSRIREHGVSRIHRMTFSRVREFVDANAFCEEYHGLKAMLTDCFSMESLSSAVEEIKRKETQLIMPEIESLRRIYLEIKKRIPDAHA